MTDIIKRLLAAIGLGPAPSCPAWECETCRDEGWIDQTVGGWSTDGWCVCPDCHNPERLPQP